MPQSFTTELLGEHPQLHLIEVAGDEISASWIRGGDGLIGFGEWQSTSVSGANRFNDARNWWQQQLAGLRIQNHVHGSGTGPILFTSFSFDENEFKDISNFFRVLTNTNSFVNQLEKFLNIDNMILFYAIIAIPGINVMVSLDKILNNCSK